MEEYTQITLDQWVQWKEDIRRKLAETAGNFVYIGYRLKQIRESGMYDGCENVFEWAQKEYGLNKSTVSRFIAINEKYSEGGNSLELKKEYQGFSQSQLVEMLSLPDAECELITEQTTIREIRELKAFDKQMNPPEETEDEEEQTVPFPEEATEKATEEAKEAAGGEIQAWSPLEKCIIDFFKDKLDLLEQIAPMLDEKEIAEAISPNGCTTHKKGTIFLFMYDYPQGVKYKQMGIPEPKALTWEEFYDYIYRIYFNHPDDYTDHLKDIYPESKGDQKAAESDENEPKVEEIRPEPVPQPAAPTACQPAEPVDVWKEEGSGEPESPKEEEEALPFPEEPEQKKEEQREADQSEKDTDQSEEATGQSKEATEAAGEAVATSQLNIGDELIWNDGSISVVLAVNSTTFHEMTQFGYVCEQCFPDQGGSPGWKKTGVTHPIIEIIDAMQDHSKIDEEEI